MQGTEIALTCRGHLPCSAVYVGQEAIAQAYCLLDGIIYWFTLLAKLVYLARSVGTMTAEYRTEQAILHPAHVEFLILRIARSRTWSLGVI